MRDCVRGKFLALNLALSKHSPSMRHSVAIGGIQAMG